MNTFVVVIGFLVVLATFIQAEQCGPNELYNECGSPCEATCQNRQFANCIAQCKRGCFCKDGYIRSETNGRCVKPRDCAKYF